MNYIIHRTTRFLNIPISNFLSSSRPSNQMGSLHRIHFHLLFASFFCFSSLIIAQQPYVGSTTADCPNPHKSSSNLGYFCNSPTRSCQSFLTFRSLPPYNSVSSISGLLGSNASHLSRINSVDESATFPTGKLVLVPKDCSCSGEFFQANVSYSLGADENFLWVANNTLQGLSTCQSIIDQNRNLNVTNLLPGERVLVPLRCACPTRNQSDSGFNYLLSYLIAKGDDVEIISQMFGSFGVDFKSILHANELQEKSTINFFTTLLVPLKTEPSSSQIKQPPPLPPPPPPSQTATPTTPASSNKTWVYVLIAVLGGGALAFTIGIVLFFVCIRKRKKKPDSTTQSDSFVSFEKPSEKKADEESSDILESISVAAQSVKVYSFKELQDATDNFSSTYLIQESVYRGTMNGDSAAIKKMNGDVSKEINLLNKINHLNVIRLSGICFNEGHWYLVYEYAANGPLNEWLDSDNSNGKFLNWTQRIQILLDVATGLNYLHSFTTPPHVHKDIKTSNILLDSDFRGKITNFGLARSAGWQEGEFSLTRHIVGTRGYMAPEYLENGLISTKLDVYAFGILIMEMLTGKEVPEFYQKENLQFADVVRKVLTEEDGKEYLSNLMDPSMAGNYPSELAVFLMGIVDRCLKNDPSQRPSMEEIVQSVSRSLSSSLSWETSNPAKSETDRRN